MVLRLVGKRDNFGLSNQNIMDIGEQTRAILGHYPKVYFACHTRHVRDPRTQRRVSVRQVQLLDHLDRIDPTPMSDLARHLGVTASTVSLTADRLEKAGYVVRERDEGDGRRVLLRITDHGEQLRQAHSVLDPTRVRALLATLSGAERDTAVKGLAVLADAATRLTSQAVVHKE